VTAIVRLGADRAARVGAPVLPAAGGVLLGALVVPGALGISTNAVALPTLSADLGLSHSEAAWVLAGYVLAQALFVAFCGRLADIRGARSVVLVGAALVATGSIVAGASGGFAALLLGRLVQGAGSGALLAAAFSIIAARYTGAERVKVLSILTTCLGVISGSGPLIGGVLADELSWRAVIALPAAALVAVGPTARLALPPPITGTRLDAIGAVLVAVVVSMLVLLLKTPAGSQVGWTLACLGALAGAAAALAHRLRAAPDGFIPAAIGRSRRYVLGTLTAMTLFAAYVGLLFAAPSLLLREHDWSPTGIGLILFPAALVSALSPRLVGRLLGSRDPFHLAAALAAVSAAGLVLGGLGNGAPVTTVLALGMVLLGLTAGQAVLVDRVPLMAEPSMRSLAAGLFTMVFVLGGALGTAAVAGLSEPFGLAGAVACLALLPAAGALLALAAAAPAPNLSNVCCTARAGDVRPADARVDAWSERQPTPRRSHV
jgi:MFS family permease